jgi:hypothetical protein
VRIIRAEHGIFEREVPAGIFRHELERATEQSRADHAHTVRVRVFGDHLTFHLVTDVEAEPVGCEIEILVLFESAFRILEERHHLA